MPITIDYSIAAPKDGGFKALKADQIYKIPHHPDTLKSVYTSREAAPGELSRKTNLPKEGHFRIDIPKGPSYPKLNDYLHEVQAWLDNNLKDKYRLTEYKNGVDPIDDKGHVVITLAFQSKSDASNFEKAFIEETKSPFKATYKSNANFQKKNELARNFGKALSFGWKTDAFAAAPEYPDIIEACVTKYKKSGSLQEKRPDIHHDQKAIEHVQATYPLHQLESNTLA